MTTALVNAERLEGEGDIAASYSADVIAMNGRIRAPFSFGGALWVCVDRSNSEAKSYRLMAAALFEGKSVSYRKRTMTTGAAEEARNDPKGFYHGMTITWRGKSFVLQGPEVKFVGGEIVEEHAPEQRSLFT